MASLATGSTGTAVRRGVGQIRRWSRRRRLIAAAVTVVAVLLLVSAGGFFGLATSTAAVQTIMSWWALPAVIAASVLAGLIVASYFETPIGADATMCDTRWPTLGLVATYLATEIRSLDPILTGAVRPVFVVAALALLVWALRERLQSEAAALSVADTPDGEVCATCRPLFPRKSVPINTHLHNESSS